MSHKDERQQLWIILLIVFIGFVGTSIAYPIFPPLFLHPTDGSIVPSTWNANARNIFLGIALAGLSFRTIRWLAYSWRMLRPIRAKTNADVKFDGKYIWLFTFCISIAI